MPAAPNIYTPISSGALRQGEILSNVVQLRATLESIRENATAGTDLFVVPVLHPWVIIMSQDCDLDWDHKARTAGDQPGKLLPSVLFCELASADDLRDQQDLKANLWQRVRQNKDERYQFLQKVTAAEDALGEGLPELAMDFKRYFTIPADEVYTRLTLGTKRRCRLVTPYLHQVSNRFAHFQQRVALPAEHFSE